MRNKRGQSILEYVIVLTVIVAAIAFGATKYLGPAITNGLWNVNQSITNATGKLPGASATAPAANTPAGGSGGGGGDAGGGGGSTPQ